jgi:AP-3 complex subunit beta
MAAAVSAASAAAARIGAVLSDAQYFESGMVRVEDIRRLLDSRSLKDKLDAMKRVVALISLGRDASVFFPDVVKNVVAPSLDVKKLVYLYLVHYAEDKQDLALLSINSFQKDISDHNELIRALALRVLSSIRVKVILQIVILAISKCAKDPSPYVRKAAAHAICKVISLDTPSREVLIEPLTVLLNDRSLEVLGSAVAVLDEVAPQRVDLVHRHFRHLCRSLPDMDPCGQVAVLRLLLRYSRTHFLNDVPPGGQRMARDPDLSSLLAAVHPLLVSQQASVVIAAVSVLHHLSDRTEASAFATVPLMRLVLSDDAGVQYVALRAAADFAAEDPGALLPYLSDLFVSAADGAPVRGAKLAVLTRLCETAANPSGLGSSHAARVLLLAEFQSYVYRSDKALAAAATRAMGCLAVAHPSSRHAVVSLLVSVVAGPSNAVVVSESVTALRRLLQLHPTAQARALPRLISLLLIPRGGDSAIVASEARAAIVWLIGEFYDKVPHVAPEALRLLARDFGAERAEVKLQILNLAAKVVAWERFGCRGPSEHTPVPRHVRVQLLSYLTSSGVLDADYDVRDKARMLRRLLVPGPDVPPVAASTEALLPICEAILRGKGKSEEGTSSAPGGWSRNDAGGRPGAETYILGSLSHVLGSRLAGCRSLPPWAASSSARSLRDDARADPRTGGGVQELACVSSADFVGNFATIGHSSVALGRVDGNPAAPQGQAFVAPHRPARFTAPDVFYDSESASGASESDGSSSSCETGSSDGEDEALVPVDGGAVRSRAPAGPAAAWGSAPAAAVHADANTSSLFDSLSTAMAGSGIHGAGNPSRGPTGTRRAWQTAVESWNARGVEVKVSFSGGSTGGPPDATHLALCVTNTNKTGRIEAVIRSSALSFDGGPHEAEVQLGAGAVVELRALCQFAGRTTPATFTVWLDGGEVGAGEIRPTAGQILRPLPSLSSAEFGTKERSLGGMFGCVNEFAVPPPAGALVSGENTVELAVRSSRSRVLDAAFLAEVLDHSVGGAARLPRELRFAGFLPSCSGGTSEARRDDVLVRLQVGDRLPLTGAPAVARPAALDAVPLSLWVGCENVVYANTLAQVLKRALSSHA